MPGQRRLQPPGPERHALPAPHRPAPGSSPAVASSACTRASSCVNSRIWSSRECAASAARDVAFTWRWMNDLLVADCAAIPLVQRAAEKYGISRTLRDENVAASNWEPIYWNVANWNRAD